MGSNYVANMTVVAGALRNIMPKPVVDAAAGTDYLAGDGTWKSIAGGLGYTPANDSAVVHIAGAETITGRKTFSSDLASATLYLSEANSTRIKLDTASPASTAVGNRIDFQSAGNEVLQIRTDQALLVKPLRFGPGAFWQNGDVQLQRYATGPAVEVNAAGGLRVRDLAGTADAPITVSNLTASGYLENALGYFQGNATTGFKLKAESGQALSVQNYSGTDYADLKAKAATFSGTSSVNGGVTASGWNYALFTAVGQVAAGAQYLTNVGTTPTYQGLYATYGDASTLFGVTRTGMTALANITGNGVLIGSTTGPVKIASASAVTFRNTSNTADQDITAGAATFSGNVTISDDKSIVRSGSSLHGITFVGSGLGTGRLLFQTSMTSAGQTGFRFANASNATLFDIDADGVVRVTGRFWANGGLNIPVINTTTNTVTMELRGAYGGGTAGNSVRITGNGSSAGNYFPTAGIQNTLSVGGVGTNEKWQPSSGTATWNGVVIDQEINTSGTYAGTVRGFYFNPTRTAETGVTYIAFESAVGDVLIGGSGKLSVGGSITLVPAASATPASNGQLTFEATSDTTLTFKYKGSDGIVRSGSLTLA